MCGDKSEPYNGMMSLSQTTNGQFVEPLPAHRRGRQKPEAQAKEGDYFSRRRPSLALQAGVRMGAYNFFGQNGEERVVRRDQNGTHCTAFRREAIEKQLITGLVSWNQIDTKEQW